MPVAVLEKPEVKAKVKNAFAAGKAEQVHAEIKNLPASAELPKTGLAKARGGLRKYANPNLIPFEKKAWEKAAVEKYAKQ